MNLGHIVIKMAIWSKRWAACLLLQCCRFDSLQDLANQIGCDLPACINFLI